MMDDALAHMAGNELTSAEDAPDPLQPVLDLPVAIQCLGLAIGAGNLPVYSLANMLHFWREYTVGILQENERNITVLLHVHDTRVYRVLHRTGCLEVKTSAAGIAAEYLLDIFLREMVQDGLENEHIE